MVAANWEPILIDFGLAYVMPRPRGDSGRGKWMSIPHIARVGKLIYFAPEMYNQDGLVREYSGEAVDTWCLGVSLFILIVGAPPGTSLDHWMIVSNESFSAAISPGF